MEAQFRHGSGKITLEFPGGIVEKEEDSEDAAFRELEEETGIKAGKITFLGNVTPNAAFIKSYGSVYMAEDLYYTGKKHLDPNEQIEIYCVPVKEAISKMGTEPFNHGGLLISAFFYLKNLIK